MQFRSYAIYINIYIYIYIYIYTVMVVKDSHVREDSISILYNALF